MRLEPLRLPSDRADVAAFLERQLAAGRHGLSESKHALVAGPERWPGLGLVGWQGRRVVAYAGMAPARGEGEWALEVVCPPARAVAMVVGAVGSLARQGATRVRWWVYDADLRRIPPYLGFFWERDLLQMGRPLPGPSPEDIPGVEVRPFRPGRDEETWIRLNNAAFADHHENGAVTGADLERRMSLPWFDPSGLRMAWEGERAVGFCWTKVHPDGHGEIYIVGADPRHQGRGLGRLLVTEGMRYLAARGCPRLHLYTDADNEAAVGLYSALGFEVESTYQAFSRSL